MPDIFASITNAPDEMLEVIANVLETRAAIPSQQEMTRDYLSDIPLSDGASVLEVGCGTGPICRVLAEIVNGGNITGIDPSEVFIDKARSLSADEDGITYEVGDGKALRFPDGTFDAVVLHTLLTHVPGPEDYLAEAYRVLKPGGYLGVCDGDFSTATLQTGDGDPLEACTAAFVDNFVNDKWLVRRMTALAQDVGFVVSPLKSYGLVETLSPALTMTWIDRGADALAAQGRISENFAEALKAEGRWRAQQGAFFGYMAYAAFTASKPA